MRTKVMLLAILLTLACARSVLRRKRIRASTRTSTGDSVVHSKPTLPARATTGECPASPVINYELKRATSARTSPSLHRAGRSIRSISERGRLQLLLCREESRMACPKTSAARLRPVALIVRYRSQQLGRFDQEWHFLPDCQQDYCAIRFASRTTIAAERRMLMKRRGRRLTTQPSSPVLTSGQ